MPLLNGNESDTCDNCGTQTTKLKLARHEKRGSVWKIALYPRSQFLHTIPIRINSSYC